METFYLLSRSDIPILRQAINDKDTSWCLYYLWHEDAYNIHRLSVYWELNNTPAGTKAFYLPRGVLLWPRPWRSHSKVSTNERRVSGCLWTNERAPFCLQEVQWETVGVETHHPVLSHYFLQPDSVFLNNIEDYRYNRFLYIGIQYSLSYHANNACLSLFSSWAS